MAISNPELHQSLANQQTRAFTVGARRGVFTLHRQYFYQKCATARNILFILDRHHAGRFKAFWHR